MLNTIKEKTGLFRNKYLMAVLCTLLGFYGLRYYQNIITNDQFGKSIASPIVLVLLFFFWLFELSRFAKFRQDNVLVFKKHLIFSYVIAVIFCSLTIMGGQLVAYYVTDGGFIGKGLILLRGAAFAFILLPFIFEATYLCSRIITGGRCDENTKTWKSSKVFLFSFLAILLCWIPVFLAYYPAVMTYDFHRQSQEAMRGFIWFNSYQPLIHTLYIWLCFQIGKGLGSLQTGMAFYSIGQMLVMSLCYGYGCSIIYRLCKKKWAVIVSVVFLALCPFISVMAVSATKDSLFSAFFVLSVCLLIERTFFLAGRKKLFVDILWVVEGIFTCLWRNNCVYAYLVFSIGFLMLTKGREKIRVLIMCAVLVVGGMNASNLIQNALGSEIHGSKVERYSPIMQTVARVGYYHGSDLDDEMFDFVHTLVDCEYWQYYAPNVSDPIKSRIAGDNYINFWEPNMGKVLKMWLKIGVHYPNEYIDGFLETIRGFWYIDDYSWAEIWYDPGYHCGALSTNNTTYSDVIPDGIDRESKFPLLFNYLDPLVSENKILSRPIIHILKPALYSWLILLSFVFFVHFRQKGKCLISLFPLLYLGTQFLGPIVQVRYALPFMALMPILLAMWGYREKAVSKQSVTE